MPPTPTTLMLTIYYIPKCIGELYVLEDQYRRTGFDAEAVRKARNSTQTLEIFERLRSNLDILLADGYPPQGELMEKAVRYLDSYWTQIFRYTGDVPTTISQRGS